MGFSDNSKYTMKEIKAVMINEGLDYAIHSWLTIENIADEELKNLCKQFQEVREKIIKRMEQELGEGACSGL